MMFLTERSPAVGMRARHWERLAVLPFIRRLAMRQVAKNIRYSTSYMAWVATRKLGSP